MAHRLKSLSIPGFVLILALVMLGQHPGSALGQSTATVAATPGGPTGTLNITRFSCVGDPEQTRIEIVASGTPVAAASATADECTLSSGDFVLLWDSGSSAQVITVPSTGSGTFADIQAQSSDGSALTLVDSASSATISVPIAADGVTSVVSWEYIAPEPTMPEFPTMAPFPTFPPMPTMRPFPTMPPFPTFPPDMESEAGAGSNGDTGSTGTSYKTGKSDTTKQLGFLLLAVLAFVGIQIWKRRSKAQAAKADKGKPKR